MLVQVELSTITSLTEKAESAERYESALRRIREEGGKVCENFELCNHRSCDSSCGSWLIANEALNPSTDDEDDEYALPEAQVGEASGQ